MTTENLRVQILLCALVCEQEGMMAENAYKKIEDKLPSYGQYNFDIVKNEMIALLEKLK